MTRRKQTLPPIDFKNDREMVKENLRAPRYLKPRIDKKTTKEQRELKKLKKEVSNKKPKLIFSTTRGEIPS